jgi:YVTN family beta-propeller protein
MVRVRKKTSNPSFNLFTSFFIFCILLFSTFPGCTTPEERKRPFFSPYQGQVTLFLNGPEKTSLDITFELLAVHIISEDGISREVMTTPRIINSIDVTGRQVLLSEQGIPEGKYKKLQLVVKKASIKRKDRIADLALPSEAIEKEVNVSVRKQSNASLFLSWNPDASIVDGFQFDPVFTVRGQVPEVSSLLIYVTNEDSNNVSVINRQTGKTVATVMVGEKPRGIVAGLRKERLKVYVSNSGSNSISVIDPTVNKVETEIPIRLGWEPEGIDINRGTTEKEFLFVANYSSNTVSVVDTTTYKETEKINVGNGPIAVAADPPAESLIGTPFLNFEDINTLRNFRERFFNVYVANKNSNSVSILRIDKLSGQHDKVITVDVEWSPLSLYVDYQRGKVYVANYTSDKLSVLDIPSIVKGNVNGAVSEISDIGNFTTGVIADPSFRRIYILKESPGEVMIIRPFNESFQTLETVILPIIGTIPVGSRPRSFIIDPEARKLYVVNRGSNDVSVIDKTTKRKEQTIPVGMNPYGIAILQN